STTTATQVGRLLHLINGPLDDDILLPRRFDGAEQVSGLFRYEADLLAERFKAEDVSAELFLGRSVTISAAVTPDYLRGPRRYFNGIVSRFTQGETDARFTQYHMEIVPWLWLLTQTADCRIFQDLTVPEIVKRILDEFAAEYPTLVSYRFALGGTYTKLD